MSKLGILPYYRPTVIATATGVADLVTTAATWFKGPLVHYRLTPLLLRTLNHPDPVVGLSRQQHPEFHCQLAWLHYVGH